MTNNILDEIENDGSKDYWNARDRDGNPYNAGTPESEAWYSGWDQADEENDDDEPCQECNQPLEDCFCEHEDAEDED